MAQLTSFLMTADGDWKIPLERVPDRATYVRQNLSVTLNFWLGEWFLDTREGVPFFETMFGHKYDKALIESVLTDAARATLGVGSVDSLTLRYDNPTRNLFADLVATTDEGDDVSGPFLVALPQGGSAE